MPPRYCTSVKDLTLPEQFLYDVLGVEEDKARRFDSKEKTLEL